MALRIKIPHVSRRGNGEVPGVGNATLQVYLRNDDGTNGAVQATWTAATGGTSSTSARGVSADGTYNFWIGAPGPYNVVETIDGTVMPAISWGAVAGKIEAFINATMTNSWIADGVSTPGYTKTSEGLVVVRGHATRASGSTLSAFTLPVGYRPEAEVRFINIGTSGGSINVSTGGLVTFSNSATDAWFDTIRFPAA